MEAFWVYLGPVILFEEVSKVWVLTHLVQLLYYYFMAAINGFNNRSVYILIYLVSFLK